MRPVADDEGWERRMSERAKARALVAEVERHLRWVAEPEPVGGWRDSWSDAVAEDGNGRVDRIATDGDWSIIWVSGD